MGLDIRQNRSVTIGDVRVDGVTIGDVRVDGAELGRCGLSRLIPVLAYSVREENRPSL
jgi:hypothetical protein